MIRDLYHADDSPASVAAFQARSEQRPHPTVPPMAKDAANTPLFTNRRKDTPA